ncbi:hypothetical protein DFH08DRAFT_964089 [Mycena albidolilacea]|uniref:Uncharacterized protein n=1 Tax=Mycena albidolilacea TaxID=1033008 RepID=A0AAD7ELV7_9AGAR|nr:hypothetical protein DFH08DRAFT_964089 [Mycena albidolilacea]
MHMRSVPTSSNARQLQQAPKSNPPISLYPSAAPQRSIARGKPGRKCRGGTGKRRSGSWKRRRERLQVRARSAEKAIDVGASTQTDARAYVSNHSSCVDAFVPGVNVLQDLSSCKGGPHAFATTLPEQPPNFFGASECAYVVPRAVSPRPFASILPAPVPDGRDTRTLTPTDEDSLSLRQVTTGNPTVLPANTVNLLVFNNATVFSLL